VISVIDTSLKPLHAILPLHAIALIFSVIFRDGFVFLFRYVDQTLDFTSYLNPHVFKGFKYYTEVEVF
jgi:hypothetical protein